MRLHRNSGISTGVPPWLVPSEFRPVIPGFIALDDGTFARELRFPIVEPGIRPKRWATITLSGGPAETSALGQNTGVSLPDVDAGDSIVVGALWGHATVTLSSINISGESDATLLTARGPVAPDNTRSILGYLSNVTSGGSKTVTFNMSGTVSGAGLGVAVAFAGGNTSGFFDVEGFANGTGTTASVNLTTSLSNALIFALANSNNGDLTAGGGYTAINLSNARHWYIEGQYLAGAGAAGTKTVSMTTGGSGAWTINAAAFKSADGTAGSSAKPAFYYSQL